jgi:hypothetical protein
MKGEPTMANKTYTVRVATGAPDSTSEQVAQWLEAYLASPAELATDPGAGERTLRLSLNKEKVESAARATGEAEAPFLRRLIATHVSLPKEEKDEGQEEKVEARPKPLVLRGPARLRPEQVRPLVHMFEAGQSLLIRRAFQVPPEPAVLQAAAYNEEQREQVSVAACEVANRRAPRVLVENIDIIGLVTTIIAIETEKIERVRAVAEQLRPQRPRQQPTPQPQAVPQQEGMP